jgi:Putative lumazine-binding
MRVRSIVCVTAATLAAGCGGDSAEPGSGPSSDREQVEAVVATYLRGLAEGDGEAACRSLTSEAQARFASVAKTSTCPEAAEELAGALDDDARSRVEQARVDEVTLGGGKADVRVVSGDESLPEPIPVRQTEGTWKINAIPAEVTFRSRAAAQCIAGGMREFDSGGGHSFWRAEGRADYEDYIVATCRRADKRGLLDSLGNEPELEKIAGRVLLEMIRRGQIRDPRG